MRILIIGLCFLSACAMKGYVTMNGIDDFTKMFNKLSSDGRLEFKILPEKKSYTQNEPILIGFSIKNISNSPITINKRFAVDSIDSPDGEVSLTVFSSSGTRKAFVNLIHYASVTSRDFIKLSPGEIYVSSNNYNINKDFGFSGSDFGKYTIFAYYRIYRHIIYMDVETIKKREKIKLPLDIWTGKIKSNTIEIEIMK